MIHLAVHNKGQSLIEVLIAVVVAVAALGALVMAATTGIKNAQFSRDQVQAEKLAQEGIEWVRLQKQSMPWDIAPTPTPYFTGKSYPSPGLSYCMNSLNWNLSGNCAPVSGTIFTRTLNLITMAAPGGNCPVNAVDVVVTVSWTDSSGSHNSKRETCFTNWK